MRRIDKKIISPKNVFKWILTKAKPLSERSFGASERTRLVRLNPLSPPAQAALLKSSTRLKINCSVTF